MKNYKQLTADIRQRINPDGIQLGESYRKDLPSIAYSDVLVFVRTAMTGVSPEYTEKSKEAGNRVKAHLSRVLINVEYRFQGSVMTNTHIRGFSDIDLITISTLYYRWNPPEVQARLDAPRRIFLNENQIQKLVKEQIASSYCYDGLDDLRKIRNDSEHELQRKYIRCDISKPKAIKITNMDLKRDVDIVAANWYDDVFSILNDKGDNRGIQIYNKHLHQREQPDFPFLSINRINGRSAITNGRLKRIIRFLKNVKCQSENEIELSSFDINAIAYNIETSRYQNSNFYQLVPIILEELLRISNDANYAAKVLSVDGKEAVFQNNPDKTDAVGLLAYEVGLIYADLQVALSNNLSISTLLVS